LYHRTIQYVENLRIAYSSYFYVYYHFKQWRFYVEADFAFAPLVWHATNIVSMNNISFRLRLIILCCRIKKI